ncbi:hypothetical protein GCM10017688_64000 [Streptomyces ramulosus]
MALGGSRHGCCTPLLYRKIPSGVTVDRDVLIRLLAGGAEAMTAARDALLAGGTCTLWEGVMPAGTLAQVYERRLRRTRRIGQETLGLEQAVQRLRQYEGAVRLGRVDASVGPWAFMLFLDPEGRSVIACTGVRQRKG